METEPSLAKQKYAFVFICQAGRLETEAVLLAASLKLYLKCDAEIFAAIPTNNVFDKIKKSTLKTLESLGVKISYFENEIIKEKGIKDIKKHSRLLYSNKLYAIQVSTDADKIIYLDSDMVCLKEFNGGGFKRPFSACIIESTKMLEKTQPFYEKLFEAVGLDPPQERFKVGNTYTSPSFNAGLIALDQNLTKEFCKTWITIYKKIETKNVIPQLRKSLTEQIIIPLVLYKLKIPYENLNFGEWQREKFFHYFSFPRNMKPYERLKNQNAPATIKKIIENFEKVKKFLEEDEYGKEILELVNESINL